METEKIRNQSSEEIIAEVKDSIKNKMDQQAKKEIIENEPTQASI